jgi:L-iditol 2-dehydrogenase
MGAGPVGQSVVALASLSGAGEVVAFDGVQERLAFAKEMGATNTIDMAAPRADRLEQSRAMTRGHGFDVVIEASGNPEAVSEALDLVRDGGRVIVCGHYTDNGSVEIHPHFQINRKHVTVHGCWGSRYEHFHRGVEIAARFGEVKPWSKMASRSYPLEEVAAALAAVENRSAVKAVVRI